jgi:hypothetical protein
MGFNSAFKGLKVISVEWNERRYYSSGLNFAVVEPWGVYGTLNRRTKSGTVTMKVQTAVPTEE